MSEQKGMEIGLYEEEDGSKMTLEIIFDPRESSQTWLPKEIVKLMEMADTWYAQGKEAQFINVLKSKIFGSEGTDE